MANVQSHIPSVKSRKGAAAKPIPSKVKSADEAARDAELKLQGGSEQLEGELPQTDSDIPEEVRAQERREHEERRAIRPEQVAAFVVQNLSTPLVPEGADPLHRTPDQVAAEFNAKMQERAAEIAKEMGIEDPNALTQLLKGQAPQPPKLQKLSRNGITRPGANTKTGAIWDAADEISVKHPGQTAATIAELKAHPALRGMNDHTIKTQYARWRQFHGVKGRVSIPLQAEQKPAPVWAHGSGAYGDLT